MYSLVGIVQELSEWSFQWKLLDRCNAFQTATQLHSYEESYCKENTFKFTKKEILFFFMLSGFLVVIF